MVVVVSCRSSGPPGDAEAAALHVIRRSGIVGGVVGPVTAYLILSMHGLELPELHTGRGTYQILRVGRCFDYVET